MRRTLVIWGGIVGAFAPAATAVADLIVPLSAERYVETPNGRTDAVGFGNFNETTLGAGQQSSIQPELIAAEGAVLASEEIFFAESMVDVTFTITEPVYYSLSGSLLGEFGATEATSELLFEFDGGPVIHSDMTTFDDLTINYAYAGSLAAGDYRLRINSFAVYLESPVESSGAFTLNFEVTAIPEPAGALLIAGLFAALRRR